MKAGTRLAIVVFTLVAFGHLWRMLFAIPVTVGDWSVPQAVSVLGVLIPGGIALLLWKEAR